MKKFITTCLIVLSSTVLLFAQRDSIHAIDDVVIEAARITIPFSQQNRNITIISKEEIRKLPVKSINEILSYVAGVDVRQRGPNGSQADIGIDGGGFDQTLVLLNGVRMSDPQTGHNMMNIPVPLDAIERIEVLKGAAARVYGINAMMGVINIVTISPMKTGVQASAYSGSSFQKDDSTSNTYTNYGIQAVAGFSSKSVGSQIGIGYDGGNGYRYNTAYDNLKLFYNGEFLLTDKMTLRASGGYVNNMFGAHAFYSAPGDKEATEHLKIATGSVSADIKLNPNWKLRPEVSYRWGKDDYIYNRKKPELYHNIHETNTVDISLNTTVNTKPGTLGLGLVYRPETIHSNNLGKNHRSNTGMFAEYRFLPLKRFDLNIGAYANYNTVYGFKLYPGLDIGWQANNNIRLYTSVGTGQRLPTFTDLYYAGPSNVGNPDLQPENATIGEAGIKYSYKSLQVSVSAFYRHGVNFIDWVRKDTSSPWQPRNYTVLNTLGFNLNSTYLWSISHLASLRMYAGYAYLSPRTGNPVNDLGWTQSKVSINSLQHQFILRADLSLGNHINMSVSNRYLKRLNTAKQSGQNRAGAYDLLDARISYSFNDLQLYADVNNIMDVKYIESGVVPLPGRWATLGIQWSGWK